jgi:hypothetical protein
LSEEILTPPLDGIEFPARMSNRGMKSLEFVLGKTLEFTGRA